MIAKIYSLPSWISNIDNKPTLQAFNLMLNNSNTITIDKSQVREAPTLTNLVIQSSCTIQEWYKYNYVKFQNLWYVIKDFQYSSDNYNVVFINCELDIYLSFVLPYFDETTTTETLVFFKQKHMNRYWYMDNGTVINFSKQFYLRNKHKQLGVIGSLKKKTVDTSWSLNYNGSFAGDGYCNALLNNENSMGYLYALIKMTSSESGQYQYNQFSSMGLLNITDGWSEIQNNFYGDTTSYINSMVWWYTLSLAAGAYEDFIVLPVDVSQAMINNSGSFELLPSTGLMTNSQVYSPNVFVDSEYFPNSLTKGDFAIYSCCPQNLYYFYTGTNAANNLSSINNIYNLDPYLFQYCSFRIRGAGEDSVIDMTSFDNFTSQSFINSIYSFCINLNHPITQITNIPYELLLQYTDNVNNWIQPYGYNKVSDVWYVLNWKGTYPSSSNAWAEYQLNHLNQYSMSKNVSHLKLQEDQADIGFNAARVATATIAGGIGGFFDGGIMGAISGAANAAVNAGEDLNNSIFTEMTQQQDYNYITHGMKGDMTRSSNERLAVEANIISYNNCDLTFIFEYPVDMELYMCVNYCILNGYVVGRYLPWKYWYNRTLVNYVKCAYFSDAMVPQMNQKYKMLIDKLFNFGFRVWTSANGYMETVPFTSALSQAQNANYPNVEVNQNNNELIYMSGN